MLYTCVPHTKVHIHLKASTVCLLFPGGSLVRREVAHNLMRLIAEGTEDEATDMELRQDAVSTYIELLDKSHLPDVLIRIICWVRNGITFCPGSTLTFHKSCQYFNLTHTHTHIRLLVNILMSWKTLTLRNFLRKSHHF